MDHAQWISVAHIATDGGPASCGVPFCTNNILKFQAHATDIIRCQHILLYQLSMNGVSTAYNWVAAPGGFSHAIFFLGNYHCRVNKYFHNL